MTGDIIKIMLILPPHTDTERYDAKIGSAAGKVPPLGILYIASLLRENGHEVKVFDGSMTRPEHILDMVSKDQPDIVGISSLTFMWNKAKSLAKEIKERAPESCVVVGGPHPTIFKENCLKETRYIDIVVIGEGEYTMLEITERLERGKDFTGIRGIIYRKGKRIQKNPPRPPEKDLDKIPFPARDLVDVLAYLPAPNEYRSLPFTTMMSSRGCPFNCTYCSKINGKNVRLRSPENIMDEIKSLVDEYGIKDIQFHDDTFTIDKKRVERITSFLKEEDIRLNWSVNSRVDTIDKEMLRKMKESGCWRIFYGGESMLQKNLDTIRKGTTVIQIQDAVRWTKEVGIETDLSFIFGIPGESYQDALETIQKVKRLDPDYVKFFTMTPFPGTEIFDNVHRYGRLLSRNFDDYTTHKIVFVPKSMTLEELDGLVSTAYKSFYMRPEYFFSFIKRIKTPVDLIRGARALRALISLY